jgi:hypothetical protein
MAKVSKKKLRQLNQRAGTGVIPSVHPMTMIVLEPRGPEGSAKSVKGGKRTQSWINADMRRIMQAAPIP